MPDVMKPSAFFLILTLFPALLGGCNSPARKVASAAPPRVFANSYLSAEEVRIQAEYGHRSQLILQSQGELPQTRKERRAAEEKYGIDPNRSYRGSQQDNYVRLSFHNEGSE